jgi:vitamin B12 transporter
MKILLWGILTLVQAWPVYALQDSTGTIELEELFIQGNRLHTSFRESARNLNIITKKEILRTPAQSIPEILSYVPGVDIRQRGPLGVQADIGIRGGSFEQTLILVNGIKMTDPQTGHHAMNIPLNLYNIDRIEVLKGPGARIYGQNAFSGAVNFITSIPEKRSVGLRFSGGQHGLFGGNIDLSLPGKFSNYLSISREVSDGYRHNTDFKINNIFYQSALNLWGGELEILAGLTGRKFGANGFYASPDYTEQYEEVSTSLLSVGFRKKLNHFSISPRVYWRRNKDNYFFVRNQPGIYENLHFTNVGALEINTSWINSLGQTGMGIEYRHESIRGDWVRNGEKTRSNLDGFSRQNLGLFLEHHFKIFGLDLTPGIFISHNSDFDWNAFPGIDLGYNISPALRIYGNIGRTCRIPTFYDMYYQSPVEQGNPDLKPEEAISYELGIRFMNPAIHAELNWFYQNAIELIDWVAMPTSDTTFIWKASNFSHIRRSGIEIAYELFMENFLKDRFFIKKIQISYNFINSDLQEKDLTSRYVLENLRHQLILGMDHKIFWQIHHHFKARFNQREDTSSYWVLDSRIYWNNPRGHTVFVEATNLADTEYKEVMTPMPGRWFRAGLTYHFDIK